MIKNKFKLLIILIFAFCFLYSCEMGGTTNKEKLNSPIISLNNNQIAWDAVENADQYEIYINGTKVDTVETYNYIISITNPGSYTVNVAAIDSTNTYDKSELSNNCVYTVSKTEKLATPTIKLVSNMIVWNNIVNASGYEIYINNVLCANTIQTSYSLNNLEIGSYEIKIIAYSTKSNILSSEYSNTILYEKNSNYLTIAEVKETIDASPKGCNVSFVGTVIGYDSTGFAHVADETGVIYVRAIHQNLFPGNVVEIKGIGFIYTGTAQHPEYTRQIKSDGIEVNLYYGNVTPMINFVELDKEDLETNDMHASFHGNPVIISGVVECASSKYDFYLNDENGNHIVSIHHYSLNFQNTIDDPDRNLFLDLDGKYVTLKGVIYRYNNYANCWVIQCIGFVDDLIVHSNQLIAPTISYNNNLVEWEHVDFASKYEIYVDGIYYDQTTTNYFDVSVLDEAIHTIKIKAVDDINNYIASPFSNELRINATTIIDDVDIMMINDTHGSIFDGDTPGIARVAELISTLESENGDIIKIANGDIFQGSYESNTLRGRVLVESLNYLDFDAFVLGNHEFDWGLDEIKKYKDGNLENGEANYPFLGANIIDKNTNQTVDWLEPYTIIKYQGIEVGIIGVIGSTHESSILASNVVDYDFVDPLSIIEDLTAELRVEKGCEVVIVASHDYDIELNDRISQLSGNSRVDTILCAHTHQDVYDTLIRSDNVRIPVVQNKDKNRTASFLELTLDNNLNYDSYSYERYYVSNFNENKEFLEFLAKYQYLYDESERIIGYNSYGFTKSFLGKIATDQMKIEFNSDVAIMNTGGVRATISGGNITIGNVFEVFPFENEVIITNLSGKAIKSLYNANEGYLYFNSDFDLVNLNDNTIYKVAVIDYVFFGAFYPEFKNVEYTDTNIILRDIVTEYIDITY